MSEYDSCWAIQGTYVDELELAEPSDETRDYYALFGLSTKILALRGQRPNINAFSESIAYIKAWFQQRTRCPNQVFCSKRPC